MKERENSAEFESGRKQGQDGGMQVGELLACVDLPSRAAVQDTQ